MLAVAQALVVRATWPSYPGGIVLRFTANVKKREVVVRGVDLPDGATVDVTIDPQPENELTAQELAALDRQERASMAAYRRGGALPR